MREPVIVVHGVATRDETAFRRQVVALERAVDRQDLLFVPVFWGDLGAGVEGIYDVLPQDEEAVVRAQGITPSKLMGAVGLSFHNGAMSSSNASRGEHLVRRSLKLEEILRDAIVQELVGYPGESPLVREATTDPQVEAAVLAGIKEALPETEWLPQIAEPTVMEAIGSLVGQSLQRTESGCAVRGLGDLVERTWENLKDDVAGLVIGVDKLVGRVIQTVGGAFLNYLRHQLMPFLGRFLGDVFVYQRDREPIQRRCREALHRAGPELSTKGKPVSVIAHSFGGVIMFDMAVASMPPFWIKHLVTFGSQPPLFHVLDPRGGKMLPYQPGTPVNLPAAIQTWTNLWEPLDPLAFIAGKVFRLLDSKTPEDQQVEHLASSGLWTHSVYWEDPKLVQVLQQVL